MLTVGNQTCLAVEDMVELLSADERVTAFGLYVEGVKNGFILLWKRGSTRIQMDGAHLALAQFLEIARSLAPVK